ncbi:hypothetical protein AZI86_16750 [Bdellovibrio bacteriovorus]|uniref:J domain-containing protein n=1 Tax=Bdellovibrio bacteriovorus TaxID=959 RepID=A0A150WHA7_BDEBC|nr:hypothetical protein [Bdellovibrio bacteriovorus]KYG62481.1 hypothetical protein AZI86_16750 [Bdellovibrio bacteriovorus]
MSFQTSFKQILREKMGQQEAAPAQNPSTYIDTDPSHLAFLMSQIGKFEFETRRGHYPRPAIRPQRPRPAHAFSESQKQSFEFLKSYIHDLSEGFTGAELKTAFRKAAIRLHPDHGGSTQTFMDLKTHYQILTEIVSR